MRDRRILLSTLSFPAAVVLAAGCIPSRDNDFDPGIAPHAILTVVADGQSIGCPLTISSSGFEAVATASRGRCLLLSATGSTSPRNAALTFEYAVQASNGSFQPLSSPDITFPLGPAGSGVALLSQDLLLRLAIEAPPLTGSTATFRVTAFDGPRQGSASASVGLQNSPPVALGDPDRTFPVGGYPWAPGAPIPIVFSGARSSDPDGDPLTFRWVITDPVLPAPVTLSAPAGSSTVTFVADATPPRTIGATFTVTGGLPGGPSALSSSASVPVVTRIGVPDIWTGVATQSGLFMESIDVAHQTITGPLAPGQINPGLGRFTDLEELVPDAAGGEALVFAGIFQPPGSFANATRVVDVFSWPPPIAFLSSNVTLQYEHGLGAVQPGSNRIWIWNLNNNFDLATIDQPWVGANLYGLDLSAGHLTQSVLATTTVPDCDLQLFGCEAKVDADSSGNVWLALSGSTSFQLAAAGGGGAPVFTTFAAPSGYATLDAAIRPGTSQYWLSLNAPNSDAIPELEVIDPSASAAAVILPLVGLQHIRVIAWASGDLLWVVSPDDGIYLLDAESLLAGNAVAVATIHFLPSLSQAPHIFPSPTDGSLWATLNDPATLHLLGDGTSVRYPDGAVARFEDPSGNVLFDQFPAFSNILAFGGTNEGDGVVGIVPKPDACLILNGNGGTAYELVPSDGVLLHAAASGEISQLITQIVPQPGAAPQLFPRVFDAAISPDGTYLWTVEVDSQTGLFTGVFRYDLTQGLPVLSPPGGVGSATLAAEITSSGGFMLASAPVAGQPDFLWTFGGPIGQKDSAISVLTTDGTSTPVLTLATALSGTVNGGPPNNRAVTPRTGWAGSRSLTTNRLCFASLNKSSGHLIVQWVDPNPAIPPVTLTTNETLLPVAAPTPPSGEQGLFLGGVSVGPSTTGADACWVAWMEAETGCPGGGIGLNQGQSWVAEINSNGVISREFGPFTGLNTGVLATTNPDQIWLAANRCSPNFDDQHILLDWVGTSATQTVTLSENGGRGFLVP